MDMHLQCSSPSVHMYHDLCRDGDHGQLLQQRCPKTCGKCQEPKEKVVAKEKCLDRSPECQTYFDRCTHSVWGRNYITHLQPVFQLYKGLMRTHCGRSCGYCKEEEGGDVEGSTDTSTGASVDSKCVDNHEK